MDIQEQKGRFRDRLSSAFQGLQLLLIQSSVCIFLILAVLCMRWFGGELFADVSSLFREAMLEDTLISAVADTIKASEDPAKKEAAEASASLPVIVAPLTGGVVTSGYGERGEGDFHEGIDIAAKEGTPLLALMNGTVTTVEYEEKGYGHYVVITCAEGRKYLYAHCSSVSVKVGESVTAGDTIAFVGNTGRSSGSHLHFEWICDGKTVDPSTILPEQTYA